MKKLKRGKITQAEFDKLMGDASEEEDERTRMRMRMRKLRRRVEDRC